MSTQQSYLFDVKLQGVAKKEGFQSVDELVDKIRSTDSLVLRDRVSEAMTINETSFFRDKEPFEALQRMILPRLIFQNQLKRKLRIWVAACSTGQEAYSIAIMIREYFPELDDWDIEILGSDISEEVIKKSTQGQYTQFEVNRGVPAKLLLEYFDFDAGTWVVKPEIRNMLNFRRINLVERWPNIGPFDIVCLRNVLIYFDVASRESILNRIHSKLSSNGSLILGGGESLLRLNVPFERSPDDAYVYFRPKEKGTQS